MNTRFGKFVTLVLLLCVIVGVSAWSYRQVVEVGQQERVMDQLDESLDSLDKSLESALRPPALVPPTNKKGNDSIRPITTAPPKAANEAKGIDSYTDAEKNALWWRITTECRTDKRVPEGTYSIDTAKVPVLATELHFSVSDLVSFWQSGQAAKWRTADNPNPENRDSGATFPGLGFKP